MGDNGRIRVKKSNLVSLALGLVLIVSQSVFAMTQKSTESIDSGLTMAVCVADAEWTDVKGVRGERGAVFESNWYLEFSSECKATVEAFKAEYPDKNEQWRRVSELRQPSLEAALYACEKVNQRDSEMLMLCQEPVLAEAQSRGL